MLHWTVQSPRSQVSMRTRIEEEMTKAYALWPPARARFARVVANGAHARRGRPFAGLALACDRCVGPLPRHVSIAQAA